MAVAVVAREQAVECVDEVVVGACAGFDDGNARGGMGREHVAEPVATPRAERADLIGEIDQRDKDSENEPLIALRKGVAEHLFDEVAGMSLDNFIVRPQRRFVERFQAKDVWAELTSEDRTELAEHVAGL